MSSKKVRHVKRWTPFERVDPATVHASIPDNCETVYANSRWIVFVFAIAATWMGRARLVMFRKAKRRGIAQHSWADFQRAKNELFGRSALAVEFYPPENDLVDVADVYWLWVVLEPKPDIYRQWKGWVE